MGIDLVSHKRGMMKATIMEMVGLYPSHINSSLQSNMGTKDDLRD